MECTRNSARIPSTAIFSYTECPCHTIFSTAIFSFAEVSGHEVFSTAVFSYAIRSYRCCVFSASTFGTIGETIFR